MICFERIQTLNGLRRYDGGKLVPCKSGVVTVKPRRTFIVRSQILNFGAKFVQFSCKSRICLGLGENGFK